jgi:HTH-type transcriptional regulator/antitoxin HipB
MRVYSDKAFAQIIRSRRKKLGLTQADLGKRAVLNQTTLSLIENGNPATRLDTILRLLSALDLDLVTESLPPRKELT